MKIKNHKMQHYTNIWNNTNQCNINGQRQPHIYFVVTDTRKTESCSISNNTVHHQNSVIHTLQICYRLLHRIEALDDVVECRPLHPVEASAEVID